MELRNVVAFAPPEFGRLVLLDGETFLKEADFFWLKEK